MKKIIALLTAFVLILGTVAIPVTAAGIDDSIIFDLDFDDYSTVTEEAYSGIKNRVLNNTTTFTKAAVAGKGEIIASNGTVTPYLEIAENTNSAKEIRFKDPAIDAIAQNGTPITIETWVFEEASAITGRQFLFTYNLPAGTILFEQCNNSYGAAANGRKHLKLGFSNAAYVHWDSAYGIWKHMVFVREPNGDNYKTTIYRNGSVVASGELSKVAVTDSEGAIFNIGGGTISGNRADLNFVGKIASFKIYGGAMTEAEAAAKYEQAAPNFVESVSAFDNAYKIVDINIDNFDEGATNLGVTNTGLDTSATLTAQNLTKGTIAGTNSSYFEVANATDGGIKVASPSLNSAKEYTFETWTYQEAAAGFMFLYGAGAQGNSKFHYQASGKIQAGLTSGIGLPYTLGEWRHLVFTRRITDSGNDELRVYENGSLVIERETTKSTPAPDHLHIGGGTYGAGYGATGKFHTFKVYNKWMDASIVAEKYNEKKDDLADPLIFDLDLSAYSASNKVIKNAVRNSSQYINVSGTPTPLSFKSSAGQTPYIEFNNAEGTAPSNKITITDPELGGTKELTVDMWVYHHGTGSWDVLAQLMQGANNLFQINNYCEGGATFKAQVRPTGKLFDQLNDARVISNLEKWTHITTVREYSGGMFYSKIYINGKLYGTNREYEPTADQLSVFDAKDLILSVGGSYRGCLGDLKIYRKALSAEAIAAEHTASADAFSEYLAPEVPETHPNAVFSLGIINYNPSRGSANKGILNKGSDKNAVIDTATGFTLGKIESNENISGREVLYLDASNHTSGIAAQIPELNKSSELTFETWVKDEYDYLSGRDSMNFMFLYSSSKNGGSNFHLMEEYVEPNGPSTYSMRYSDGNNGTLRLTRNVGDWKHMVFTRKVENGKTIVTVYENGKLLAKNTEGIAVTADNSNAWLHIGGYTYSASANFPFQGKYATFKAYNKALTADEVAAAYNASFEDFEKPATVLNVTPSIEANTAIEGGSGEITLDFNTVLDEDTIDTIKLYDSKGNEAKRVTVTPDGKKAVKIAYSDLTYGENYNLDVSMVQSANGLYCTTFVIPYKVKSNVIMDEDFEDATKWKTTAEDANYVLPTDGPFVYQHGTANTTDTSIIKDRFFIAETEGGNRFLRMKASGDVTHPNGNLMLRIPLPEKIEDKALVIEAEMRRATTDNTGSGGATRSGIRLFDSGAGSTNVSDGASADYAAYTHYSTFYKNEANITTKPQSTTPFKSGSVAAKDGDEGFVKLRVVAQKNKATGRFEIYMIDGYNDAKFAVNDSCIPNIATVAPLHLYTTSAAQLNSTHDLGAIKISTQVVPEITKVENYNAKTRTFDVYVNVDVLESTLITDNIYVTQNGERVPAASVSAFDEDNRKFTVTLSKELDGGKTTVNLYNVNSKAKIPFIQTAEFSVEALTAQLVGSVAFTDQNGDVAYALNGVTSLKAKFSLTNNSAATVAPKVILALYNGNNFVKCAVVDADEIKVGETLNDIEVTLTGIAAAEGYSAKLLVWDNNASFAPILGSDLVISYQSSL